MSLILWFLLSPNSYGSKLDYHQLRSQLAIGFEHMCIISKGKIRCWQEARNTEVAKLLGMPLKVGNPLQIVAGDRHTCVLDGEDVKCNHVYRTWWQPHKFRQVREIAAIEDKVCALDKEGMKCWGADSKSQSWEIKGLKNPRLLTTGGFQEYALHTMDSHSWKSAYNSICLVDGNELYCHGEVGSGRMATARPLKNPQYLNVSSTAVCIIDDLGKTCTNEKEPPAGVLPVKIPDQIEGRENSCYLSERKVYCRNYKSGTEEIPLPFEPLFISSGPTDNVCAVAADFEMKCWGVRNTNVPWRLPDNISKVAIGQSHLCVLAGSEVRCYGEDNWGALFVPGLKNPYELTTSASGTCALDDDGLKCWTGRKRDSYLHLLVDLYVPHPQGERFYRVGIGPTTIYLTTEEDRQLYMFSSIYKGLEILKLNPQMTNLADLSSAPKPICLPRDGKPICVAGRELKEKSLDALKALEEKKYEMASATSADNFCVWEKSLKRMTCSNEISSLNSRGGIFHIPWQESEKVKKHIVGNRHFSLDGLAAQLRTLARYSQPARRIYFEQVADFIDRNELSEDSRWFLLKLLEPAVLGADSPFFLEEIAPAYRQAIGTIESELKPTLMWQNNGQTQVALRVIAASLTTLSGFLNPDERLVVLNALRDLARVFRSSDPKIIRQALVSVEAIDLSKFNSPKSDFLVESLRTAKEWLKAEFDAY